MAGAGGKMRKLVLFLVVVGLLVGVVAGGEGKKGPIDVTNESWKSISGTPEKWKDIRVTDKSTGMRMYKIEDIGGNIKISKKEGLSKSSVKVQVKTPISPKKVLSEMVMFSELPISIPSELLKLPSRMVTLLEPLITKLWEPSSILTPSKLKPVTFSDKIPTSYPPIQISSMEKLDLSVTLKPVPEPLNDTIPE